MSHRILVKPTIAAVALLALPLMIPTAAQAASPGPIQIPIATVSPPGVSCPSGTYVATNPGPQNSPYFVLKDPGPANCPAGIDVLRNPGPGSTPAGEAVALPLTNTDCQAGTAVFDQQITMLGGTPPGVGSGPPGSGPCPQGDQALSALQAQIANVAPAPAGSGAFGTSGNNPFGRLGSYLVVSPGTLQVPGVGGDFSFQDGFPIGGFIERDPGSFPAFYGLFPSNIPGVSTVCRPPGC